MLLAALATAAGCLSAVASPPPAPVPLTGELRVAACQDYPCPLPSGGDPRWSSFALGPDGIAAELGQQEGIAWVSLRFELPPGFKLEQPALLIVRPADAEEILLNGTSVPGKGRIAPHFEIAVAGPRVLRLPPATLHDGMNEISLLTLLAGRNVRVFTGPFLIGEYDGLQAESARLRYPIIALEAAFLSLFFVVFLFYGFLVIKRVVLSDYLFLMAFIACYTAEFLLGSHFLNRDGVVSEGFVHLRAVLESSLALIMLGLVTHATGSRYGRVFWFFAAGCMAFVALDLALPPLTALTTLGAPRMIFFGLRGVYYLVIAVGAVRRKYEDSVPVLAGLAAYVVGSRLDLFWGIALRDYATGFFVLCMLFALTSRHARLRNRLEEISTRLLDAHEEERRRIARDIHDGVGQSLLALRLQLQKLGARALKGAVVSREPFDEMAAATGAILEDVRRLSMDLRPSFVESMSLKDLLRWYGSSFAETRGLALSVHSETVDTPDPGPRIKDNLYRIYQEILSNIAKHAGATRVEVSFYHTGRSLVLEVVDNGRGFPGTGGNGGNGGIGMETMRERAELVGGVCRVESVAHRGTKVSVEVPAS
jgi:signal transduction histidine kinase